MDFLAKGFGALATFVGTTVSEPLPRPILPEPPRHVISFDGGGMRGIYTIEILKGIQNRLPRPLHDHIDLCTGTSTGSILSGGLSLQKSLDDMLKLYETEGPNIFYRSTYQAVETLNGMVGPKYDSTHLERLLNNYFGETRLSETKIPTLIFATDETNEDIEIFDGYKARKFPDSENNPSLKYAVRSSTAAPSYFSAVEENTKALCDGALVANNPSVSTLATIKENYNWNCLENLSMVSIGTTYFPEGISYSTGKNMGLSQLLYNSDLLFRAPVRTNTKLTRQFIGEDHFIRINDPLPKNIPLDDYSPASLTLLKEIALNRIKNHPEDIDKAAKLLMN